MISYNKTLSKPNRCNSIIVTHSLTYPKSRDVIAPKNDYGIRSEILIQPQFGFCYNLMKGLKFLYSSIGTIWIAKGVYLCVCVCVRV